MLIIPNKLGKVKVEEKGEFKVQKSYRKTSIVVGILFIIATISYFIGSGLLEEAMDISVSMGQIESVNIKIGILFEFINIFCVVSIAVLLFPMLNQFHSGVDSGYLASRIIEGTMLLIAMVEPLLLTIIESSEISGFLVKASVAWHNSAFQLGMLALSLGSLLFCLFLYKVKMIPRALSILGIVGYVALFISGWVGIFAVNSTIENVLYIPGGLFEIVFPFWLIIKGFTFTNKVVSFVGQGNDKMIKEEVSL